MIDLPESFTMGGIEYGLNIHDHENGSVTLIYEFVPQREDTFLIGATGVDAQTAASKMKELLEQELGIAWNQISSMTRKQ